MYVMNLMFLLYELNIYKPFRFTTVHAFSYLKQLTSNGVLIIVYMYRLHV